MSQDKEKNQTRTILLFLLISLLLIHLPILVGLYYYLMSGMFAHREPLPPQEKVVWIKPETLMPQQIADIEKPLEEKKPEKAKFAGQYDSSVKEEMVARPKPKPKVIQENPLSSEQAARPVAKRPPRPKVKPVPETPPEPPKEEEKPKEVAEKPEKPEKKEEKKPEKEPEKEPVKIAEKTEMERPVEKTEEKPEEKKPIDLGLKPQDVIPKQKTAPAPKVAEKKPFDLKVGPGLEYGRPSAPDLFQHDYFPDYKYGGKTYLNVMKLQDIGYFVKMKRILKMRWNPVPSVRDYIYANHISAGKIECVLGVALDDGGRIAEMFVIRSSGLGAYDQEAMQTFRDSAPFSAPPPDYVKDGRLRMSWTFTVYL